VVRVDRESSRKISSTIAARVVDYLHEASKTANAILLSDYEKGVITRETAQPAIRLAREARVPCVSNPKPRNLSCFTGVGVITLNQPEASAASGVDIGGVADAERAARKLLSATRCDGLVVTRGAHGLSVFWSNEDAVHIPAVESEVYDVAGAGDTVVSALTLALACGLDLAHAALIANCSGGAVVRKVGVATTSVREIDQLLNSLSLARS
jgi:D-beta-D-heptose 7-phosphate kinase/D-beta-D-heptose 1-phosphate adenosyltransferase